MSQDPTVAAFDVEAQLRLNVECEYCRARLLVVADRHELSGPSTFATYCVSCGKRMPFAEPLGLLHSVVRAASPATDRRR